jgi:hypothetical protein
MNFRPRVFFAVFFFLAALAALRLLAPEPIHAQQTYSPQVKTLQVTIGAGVTEISTGALFCSEVQIQNNAAHSIRVGDSATTSSRGALLASGSPGGSQTWGPFPNGKIDLSQLYIAGTQNDVIDVIYIQ